MGWASAGDIFDPMAKIILAKMKEGTTTPREAVEILSVLARNLFDGDWDTERESLEAFDNHYIIYEAFKQAGRDYLDNE